MTTSESKGRFFYKTNRFESIRIANWNALVAAGLQVLSSCGHNSVFFVLTDLTCVLPNPNGYSFTFTLTLTADSCRCYLQCQVLESVSRALLVVVRALMPTLSVYAMSVAVVLASSVAMDSVVSLYNFVYCPTRPRVGRLASDSGLGTRLGCLQ